MNAPRLWIPKAKIIEPRDPVPLSVGMAGEFRMQIYRPDGRCRLDTGFFPNLITNAGLNAPPVSGSPRITDGISVGSGNTAPAFTDTTLVSRIATTATVQSRGYAFSGTPGDADRYWSHTRTLRFAQGAAAGNIAEIGVTFSGSPFTCYSRALVLDSGGSPTTITVLSDEFLDVTYRHRWYAGSTADVNTTISISGADYDIVLRPADMDGGQNLWKPGWGWRAGPANTFGFGGNGLAVAYNGAIGTITTSPSGTPSGSDGQSTASYVADSHQLDFSIIWGLNAGNLAGGISAVLIAAGDTDSVDVGFGAAAGYQFSLDPVISKTSSHVLTLNFRQSWARKVI